MKKTAAPIKRSGKETSRIMRDAYTHELFTRFVRDTDAHVLDIGCSNCLFLERLKSAGFKNLAGADYFDYGNPHFRVVHVDLSTEQLPWPDGTFHAVTAWEVLEHLENPYFLIREAHRVLKPGGHFFISMPNIFHIRSKLAFLLRGDFTRWTPRNDHIWAFSNLIFKKATVGYFKIIERNFYLPEIDQGSADSRVLNKLKFLNRFLPENEHFSHFITYALEKRAPEPPVHPT